MVEHLMRALRVACQACLVGALCAGLPACAENLSDPTRPPSGFWQNQDAPPPGPVLQSVLISPVRRVAVISGKTLRIGDKFGNAQLVKIDENEVELRTGKSSAVLRLYPVLRRQAGDRRDHGGPESPKQQR